MNLNKRFSENKNVLYIIVGILLVTYLYLETPLPVGVLLNNTTTVIFVILFVLIACYLIARVNIFVGIIFVIIGFEIARKMNNSRISVMNLNKNKTYKSSDSKSQVISDHPQSKYSLEEEMVDSMTKIDSYMKPTETPNYQPLLPDLSSTTAL